MIVALADNFSGSTKIAGIAYRYGLSHEIQMKLNTAVECDIIIVNTQSRPKNEIEAVILMEEICFELIKSKKPIKLFKKVDSTMRGHIVPELDVLQYHFEFERIFLFPNNPSQGEVIKDGIYHINEVLLQDTIFGDDPIHPAEFSHLEDIINAKDAIFSHTHMHDSSSFPSEGLVTGDTGNAEEIKNFLEDMTEFDLCAGGVECFEMFLKVNDFHPKKVTKKSVKLPEMKLVLNGSAIKIEGEEEAIESSGFEQILLPSRRNGNTFEIQNLDKEVLKSQLIEKLKAHKRVAVSVEHPIYHEKKLSNLFLDCFSVIGRRVKEEFESQGILLALTGASTAEVVVMAQGYTNFQVKEELVFGVVMIYPSEDPNRLFIIKPGKYPWPEKIFAN